jgi:hypothetical protein
LSSCRYRSSSITITFYPFPNLRTIVAQHEINYPRQQAASRKLRECLISNVFKAYHILPLFNRTFLLAFFRPVDCRVHCPTSLPLQAIGWKDPFRSWSTYRIEPSACLSKISGAIQGRKSQLQGMCNPESVETQLTGRMSLLVSPREWPRRDNTNRSFPLYSQHGMSPTGMWIARLTGRMNTLESPEITQNHTTHSCSRTSSPL